MFELNLLPITGVLPVSHDELEPIRGLAGTPPTPSIGWIPETGTPPPR